MVPRVRQLPQQNVILYVPGLSSHHRWNISHHQSFLIVGELYEGAGTHGALDGLLTGEDFFDELRVGGDGGVDHSQVGYFHPFGSGGYEDRGDLGDGWGCQRRTDGITVELTVLLVDEFGNDGGSVSFVEGVAEFAGDPPDRRGPEGDTGGFADFFRDESTDFAVDPCLPSGRFDIGWVQPGVLPYQPHTVLAELGPG